MPRRRRCVFGSILFPSCTYAHLAHSARTNNDDQSGDRNFTHECGDAVVALCTHHFRSFCSFVSFVLWLVRSRLFVRTYIHCRRCRRIDSNTFSVLLNSMRCGEMKFSLYWERNTHTHIVDHSLGRDRQCERESDLQMIEWMAEMESDVQQGAKEVYIYSTAYTPRFHGYTEETVHTHTCWCHEYVHCTGKDKYTRASPCWPAISLSPSLWLCSVSVWVYLSFTKHTCGVAAP